jgi:nucleotide-binding universal stress UspA family protein
MQKKLDLIKIIEAAQEKAADLIVMATHGRTGLSHALMGSVAEKVVRHAPCPVLTIRPKGDPLVEELF